MSKMTFSRWFETQFGCPVPSGLTEYLTEHPSGAENGYGPRLWTAEAIQEETDDRQLASNGVCIIGAIDSLSHILLRARDGRVFIVDSRDPRSVDACFTDLGTMISLLMLE
ncbi:hypothetical protein KEH59_01915 (plasmid) [Burkholderia contaminans]|uniref:Knr4/Smi1-like domain-containing protein n=2 Tax=Burkholderia contaminans TaxID=488447 RepID=A0A250LLI5_9BURK|nr:hypothetical protein [Burkholderia contaminans]MBY4819490.1 hypothetical protein [Burkholderia contaminans]MBY4824371.1 hypothetical protein [Burkholderia contaminans]QUN45016.1 hypothetical protein KEH59_01915 [Burkholderia contaminans]BBA45367.1 hypothetical protein BCCH1_78780 [Burkholderia contaminans]